MPQIFSVAIVSLAMAVGVITGFVLPLRFFGDVPGFRVGMIIGAIAEVLGSLMIGYLAAGWLEGMIGTNYGVPLGLLSGCAIGATACCVFFGGAASLIAIVFRGRAA